MPAPPPAPVVPSASLPGSLEEAKERYESTKRALKAGLSKKRLIDRTLTDLESQIYLFEGSYLSSTAASGGNIIKGFDAYLKLQAPPASRAAAAAAAAAAANGADVPLEDRLFSTSSATYARSLELKADEARRGTGSAGAGGREAATASPNGTPEPSKKRRKELAQTNGTGSKNKKRRTDE